jgi:hypothetical protein
MSALTDVRPRTQELFAQMAGGNLYRRAYSDGMNLSTWLEEQDPSAEYKDGLDSFQRMIALKDIAVASDPVRGLWADEFDAFDQDDNTRALVPEWVARQARAVAYGHLGTSEARARALHEARSIFLSTDYTSGTLMRPYADDLTPQIQQVAPQIPLSRLIARTTGITGDTYRAFYLTRVAADLRMTRVVEATEIPRAKLAGGEHLIKLHKYGRALETSYEQLRRLRIDLVALFIQLMAVQSEVDKVVAALDILVNGDGNSGTAPTTYALTTLDSTATPGTLTLKAWLRFKMKFLNPYALTTMLAQELSLLQAMMLSTGSANVPLVVISGASNFGGFTPINPGLADNVAIGWLAEAPTSKLVGFDARFALEHVTEIGGDISEIERFVMRQTQAITLTTVDGFRTLDGNAANILDLAS